MNAEYMTTDAVISSAASIMEQTLDFIDAQYGSAEGYLLSAGMSERELAAIRCNLTMPLLANGAASADAAAAGRAVADGAAGDGGAESAGGAANDAVDGAANGAADGTAA